ncbi:unnamed protein product [Protopolystoma xenopodis]|uniref:Cytosolic fatty-acid binding proteins domain-containing protein n=1 Tax=Protopolystoma xenopodis TaxID=117903 RepID=A0A448WP22_9PLAT|nr:unnamed protein product [Protopolystoma xenopodis]
MSHHFCCVYINSGTDGRLVALCSLPFSFHVMPSPFLGRWDFVKSENFDEILKALDVDLASRGLAKFAKPENIITENDGVYTIETKGLRTTKSTFKIGEKFSEETADGRKVESLVLEEAPNKWVHTQDDSKKTTIIIREVDGEKMSIVDDVEAHREYKKRE